ncbi:MAG TPA: hypothetical protein DEQ61_12080 [Streptomyces sp.]|nr:hypothetical protein [Streptomyces sp.]
MPLLAAVLGAVANAVIEAARKPNHVLNTYGRLKRLQTGTDRDRDSPDTARLQLEATWALLTILRRVMRADLGVGRAPALPAADREPDTGADTGAPCADADP